MGRSGNAGLRLVQALCQFPAGCTLHAWEHSWAARGTLLLWHTCAGALILSDSLMVQGLLPLCFSACFWECTWSRRPECLLFSVEIISSSLSLTGLVFTFFIFCIRPPSADGSDLTVSSVRTPWVYFCLVGLLRNKYIAYVSRNSIQKMARQVEGLMLFGLFTLYFMKFIVSPETSQNFSVA